MTKVSDICDLTTLFNGYKFSKKTNVLTTSIFKMKKGYRDFNIYLNGITLLVETMIRKLPEFKFVLFTDDSVIKESDIFEKIEKLKNKHPNDFIIIRYNCINFIKDNEHVELFGTLMRFLPFFEFEDNFANTVICCDSDMSSHEIEKTLVEYANYKELHKKYNVMYHYRTNMFYDMKTNWAISDGLSIIANRHMGDVKLPLKLLIDYLKCVMDKSCSDMDKISKSMNFEKYKYFPYGIDEYFLNNIFLGYLQDHNIRYSVTADYVLTAPIYYVMRSNNMNRKKLIASIMKYAIGTNETNYEKIYKQFDKLLYIRPYITKKISQKMRKASERYYEKIKQMDSKKDYSLYNEETMRKLMRQSDNNILSSMTIKVYQNKKILYENIYNVIS